MWYVSPRWALAFPPIWISWYDVWPAGTSIIPPAIWHVKDEYKQLAAVEKEQLLIIEYLLTEAGLLF